MRRTEGELWVVTSYFNPVGYRTRLANYRTFRRHLRAPLFTVELAYGSGFELGGDDADRLLQLRSDQVLWQKERLLNLAIERLPQECRKVAWVDCDVLFAREDWCDAACAALERFALIQPYRTVKDLERGAGPGNADGRHVTLERPSMACRYTRGAIDFAASSTSMVGEYSPGHAWCARREAVAEAGLYDAMVVGGGDFAIGMASVGRCEDYVRAYAMNRAHATHYRRWSRRFHGEVRGALGVIDGELHHLWHGALEDRGYDTRYDRFRRFAFDPETDIALDANGCWRWSSEKPEMHAYLEQWFAARREDGREKYASAGG